MDHVWTIDMATVFWLAGGFGAVWAVLGMTAKWMRSFARKCALEVLPDHCREQHEMMKKESSGAVARLEASVLRLDGKVDSLGESMTGVKVQLAKLVGKLEGRTVNPSHDNDGGN